MGIKISSLLLMIIIFIIKFQAEMDSIQSFYNSDSKKLTQLNAPSRYESMSSHIKIAWYSANIHIR